MAGGRRWCIAAAGVTLVFAALATVGIIELNEVAAGSVFAAVSTLWFAVLLVVAIAVAPAVLVLIVGVLLPPTRTTARNVCITAGLSVMSGAWCLAIVGGFGFSAAPDADDVIGSGFLPHLTPLGVVIYTVPFVAMVAINVRANIAALA